MEHFSQQSVFFAIFTVNSPNFSFQGHNSEWESLIIIVMPEDVLVNKGRHT